MENNRKKSWIALNMIPAIGRVRCHRLLQRLEAPENILSASVKELEGEGISDHLAEEIVQARAKLNLDRELSLIEKYRVKIITLDDEDFPFNLRNTAYPPPVVYVRGEILPQDRISLAIVGSRRATPYGKMVAETLSRELAKCGFTIISGMARGIDTMAHQGALAVKGRTLAVLGCGVDRVYPLENIRLRDQIITEGAVISEFPMSTPPLRQNFPIRNATISGLSLGVVVVEAAEDSGALITAHHALEQGREVFAVPGNITATTSHGTHSLIKQGAKLIEGINDILEELILIIENYDREITARLKEQICTSGDKIPSRETELEVTLSPEDKKILSLLSWEPQNIELVIKKSELPVQEVIGILTNLEIKGLIKQLPGKMFVKNLSQYEYQK